MANVLPPPVRASRSVGHSAVFAAQLKDLAYKRNIAGCTSTTAEPDRPWCPRHFTEMRPPEMTTMW